MLRALPFCADGSYWGHESKKQCTIQANHYKARREGEKQQWQQRRSMVEIDGTTLYDYNLNKFAGAAQPNSRPPLLGCVGHRLGRCLSC